LSGFCFLGERPEGNKLGIGGLENAEILYDAFIRLKKSFDNK